MRRWGLGLLGLVVVVALATAAFFFWPVGLPDVAAARQHLPHGQDSIQRGEYLARAADCEACHTLAAGARYAGGLPFKLPFGVIYATNITPDKETGIGNWSDAQFVRAVRHGVGADGENLYPAFPYASYALMSDEDALAIKDYLFSLPPVTRKTPPNALKFPYDQRYLVRAWNLLFRPGEPMKPDPGRTAEQNRGAYLVEALGHCGECHTPRNRLFAQDGDRKFAGAVTAGWKAYNISSDPKAGVGAWSDKQLQDYLATGHAQGRGAASGSMAEAVEYSLRFLAPDDIKAMVAYLRTVPPQPADEGVVEAPPAAMVRSSLAAPAPDVAQAGGLGLKVFQTACASCHGYNGEGLNHPHAALAGSQTVNDPAATNLLQVLIHGSRMTTNEGDVFMPAFGRGYTDVELAAVATYVLRHFGGKAATVTPDAVAKARTMD